MSEKTETTEKIQTHLFQKGQSGNPTGRPKGARHKYIMAVQALLDGQAEALTQKAIKLAIDGDLTALRLCLERIVPPRKDTPISISLPKIETSADTVKALDAIKEAVSEGELTPTEGKLMAEIVEINRKAIETVQLEERIAKLEKESK